MIDECFQTLNLNDSLIRKICITSGEVHIHLDYIEDYNSQDTIPSVLKFVGCKKFVFDMNLDLAWPDSIMSGTVEPTDDGNVYVLELNTSGSILKIFATRVELVREAFC